jgi:hypothetical protein
MGADSNKLLGTRTDLDSGSGDMPKVLRALFIIAVLAALFIPAMIAIRSFAVAQISSYFTDHLASLLGINLYLIRVVVTLAMVPFFYGLKLLFSYNSTKRKIGGGVMTAFVVVYNIGLYQATRDLSFTFQDGKILKWYAITPEGVKFYDRAGVEPNYGIVLKPVTPEVIRNLKVIEKGNFRTVDPAHVAWFNPITGDPQLWYYQYPDGTLEFYNKPGYHPFTNEPLQPVMKDIYFRWREHANTNIPSQTSQGAGLGSAGTPSRQATQAMHEDSGSQAGAIDPRKQIIIAASTRPDGEQRSSAPTTAKTMPESTTVEQFELRVSSCNLVGDVLTCRVLATNIGQDRHLSLHQSRFVDESGQEYRSTKVQVGSIDGSWGNDLVNAVPLSLTLEFEKVRSNTPRIALLDLALWTNRAFVAHLRNIPISR